MRFIRRPDIIIAVCLAVLLGTGMAVVFRPRQVSSFRSTATTPPPSSAPSSPTVSQATVPPATPYTAPTAIRPPPSTATPPAPRVPPVPAVASSGAPQLGDEPAKAAAILLRIADAEARLRTGQFAARMEYSGGSRSSANIRFDLGDSQREPRFHIITTYTGDSGAQTFERITIGEQTWEREQDGAWTTLAAQESVFKQLQVFLPRTDSIGNFQQVRLDEIDRLYWYDDSRDAEVTLRIDAAGTPRELRRKVLVNNLLLTVMYRDWNTPVEILPPDAP